MTTAQQNFRVQLWITLLSVLLFLTKIVAYYFTHSLAILSDALESIVNVIAGFIGLYSLYIATKPKDLEHPYGHGKAEFVSAAVEGGLIVAAGIMIIYATVANILRKEPVHQLDTGLWLIGATALLNFVAGTICLRLGKKNNSLALQASGKHLQIDTYSTLAIIAGLIIILFTKMYWLDKLIALVMSILIIYNGYKIIRSSLAGIMDEADMELLKKFIEILNKNRSENWIDLHNLRVIKYGSLLHIDCHLTVPWYLNIHEAHHEIDRLSALIKQEFGDMIELFVHTDGCLPFSCRICNKNCEHRKNGFEQKLEWTLTNVISDKKHQL
ncbi:MAG: cation diffusion facilitator family transporter [Sediminibacterium sp.]|uniref:cation diffusion facilitator family transporter n=1 Tax=Sediminibacterium sp. TaxID=1917865 RepID=UPI002AB9A360|nr:cation diffusion facilitator family transporter [Sediminibacterium sp.]MDZ4070434.1 cation diffusion facilitator family transporter [Sediminibacterium sp.]